MKQLLKKLLPFFILQAFRTFKSRRKLNKILHERDKGNIISGSHVIAAFHDMGISSGDTVMLHSSLSRIGYVEGGADTIIDSLLQIIGPDGTLVMPAFPAVGYNYDYLRTEPVFSLNETPSRMGIITENFRKRAGVKRSFHPTDSVCALGKHAQFITSGHFDQLTPYNKNSPFYKLCELKAKILLLGVDFDSLTNLHTLEDAAEDFKYPVYHSRIFTVEMKDGEGIKRKMQTRVHDPEWSRKRKCNELIPLLRERKLIREGKLGNATILQINANELHHWMLEQYREHGVTMYTPKGE